MGIISCSWEDDKLSTTEPCLQDFHKRPQKVPTENCLNLSTGKFCKNVSARPTSLFGGLCWEKLLLLLFLLPLSNYCLNDCFPTFFAALLKLFPPLATSAILDTASSNKSAPTRFAGRTKYKGKLGKTVLTKLCKSTESPSTLSTDNSVEKNLYLL